MAELKIYLSNDLSDKFRKMAMSVFGYGRGSLSKAAEEAFSKWCEEHDKLPDPTGKHDHSEAAGVASEKQVSHVDPDERKSSEPVNTTGILDRKSEG